MATHKLRYACAHTHIHAHTSPLARCYATVTGYSRKARRGLETHVKQEHKCLQELKQGDFCFRQTQNAEIVFHLNLKHEHSVLSELET